MALQSAMVTLFLRTEHHLYTTSLSPVWHRFYANAFPLLCLQRPIAYAIRMQSKAGSEQGSNLVAYDASPHL
jgi:hypothetical protein